MQSTLKRKDVSEKWRLDYIEVAKKYRLVSEYFCYYHSLERYKYIRPELKTGDPVIVDIVALKYF